MLVTSWFSFALTELQKRFQKKLYAKAMGPYSIIRKLGSNAYLLDLPNDMDIGLVFNIKNFLPYRDTFDSSTLPSSVSEGKASKGAPTMPSLQYSKEMVEIIFDDVFVTSRDEGFRRFLVKWHGHLDYDTTWIQEDDLRHLDPSLLDCYLSSHSLESSSVKPEKNSIFLKKGKMVICHYSTDGKSINFLDLR